MKKLRFNGMLVVFAAVALSVLPVRAQSAADTAATQQDYKQQAKADEKADKAQAKADKAESKSKRSKSEKKADKAERKAEKKQAAAAATAPQ